jgi:sRNA-binding protein
MSNKSVSKAERLKALEFLRQRYPNAFREKGDIKLLEIGAFQKLKEEIWDVLPELGIRKRAVKMAITHYTEYNREYLKARKVLGAPRINLQGEVVGEVTEEHIRLGEEVEKELERQKQIRAEKEKQLKEKAEAAAKKAAEKATKKAAKKKKEKSAPIETTPKLKLQETTNNPQPKKPQQPSPKKTALPKTETKKTKTVVKSEPIITTKPKKKILTLKVDSEGKN